MDVVQKTKDLIKLALHDGTPDTERVAAAFGALRLIEQYELLGTKKGVDVAAEILEKYTSPLFFAGIAERAEQIAGGIERILGSAQKIAGAARRGRGPAPKAVAEAGSKKRRRYTRR